MTRLTNQRWRKFSEAYVRPNGGGRRNFGRGRVKKRGFEDDEKSRHRVGSRGAGEEQGLEQLKSLKDLNYAKIIKRKREKN